MEKECILKSGERFDIVNDLLRLIQKKEGLTFGTDAYLLAAFVRPMSHARAAELGSGTGIISLLLAARKKLWHIDAYEIQEEFAELGRRNIELNGLGECITQYAADIRALPHPSDYDVVFSNPPYMKSGGGKSCATDMKNIARHEEAGTIYDFCAAAARLLKYGGLFYTVWRPDRLADLIDGLRQNKLEPKRMTFVCSDADTPPSMVLVESKLGASPSLNVTAPLIIYREGASVTPRVMTERAARVYEECIL